MTIGKGLRIRVLTVLTGLIMITPAPAQELATGGSALENVRLAAARAPGLMVAAGIDTALNGPTIAEPEEPVEPEPYEDVFLPQARTIIADWISDTIIDLVTLLLARAGADVALPADLTPDDGSSGDGSSRDPGGSRDPRGARSRLQR